MIFSVPKCHYFEVDPVLAPAIAMEHAKDPVEVPIQQELTAYKEQLGAWQTQSAVIPQLSTMWPSQPGTRGLDSWRTSPVLTRTS